MLRTLKQIFKSQAAIDRDNFCHGYTAAMRALIVPDITLEPPKKETKKFNDGSERAREDYLLSTAIQKARIHQLQTDLSHAKIVEETLRERVKKLRRSAS